MPRFWAVINISQYFRIGGLFVGLIRLFMATMTIFGFIILVFAAWVLVPLWIWILFVFCLLFGVLLGIVGIAQNLREEDMGVPVDDLRCAVCGCVHDRAVRCEQVVVKRH